MIKARIYIIEDDRLMSRVLQNGLEKEGYMVFLDEGSRGVIERLKGAQPDIIILDIALPGKNGIRILEELRELGMDSPVIMLTADAKTETVVTAIKLGAYDYITKPFAFDKLTIVIKNAIESKNLKRKLSIYKDYYKINIIGRSPVMMRLYEDIKRIAESKVSTVLITGESGTGKELFAMAIRNLGPECYHPFVAVNCSAVPSGLLESELFGYEKGAFTDAKETKRGLFELPDGGTVLLDEIGDMDISLQAKLLRVIENRTIRRVGGLKEIDINVMIIATTNKDLFELQKRNEFRPDLFHRLNMVSLHIPPLRERKEDILPLVEHFISIFNKEFHKTFKGVSEDAMKVILNYEWPGNARELKNLIAKIVLFEEPPLILPKYLEGKIPTLTGTIEGFTISDSGLSLDEVEKNLIIESLKRTKGNRALAAKLLNITYDTMRYRMKKYGLS